MYKSGDEDLDIEAMPLVKWLRKIIRIVPFFKGDNFFIKENGYWHATPLFITFLFLKVENLITCRLSFLFTKLLLILNLWRQEDSNL